MNLSLLLVYVLIAVAQVGPSPQQPSGMRHKALACPNDFGFVGIAGDSRSTPLLPTTDWPAGMSEMIRATNGSLLNVALGGSVATVDVSAGWPIERTGPWQVQELIDNQVDLIVIAFGVNDINNEGHIAIEVFADLSVLVGMCQQAGIPFIVATIEFMLPPHLVGNNPIVAELNGFILATGWPVLDFAPVTNDPIYTDDGLHTNEAGRLIKARFAADVFCSLL